MTSGLQPRFSGAPTPVPGVTGGPPLLGGQISNDPNDGSVVVSPNPGNVLQVRKGSQPTALQIYEYFHTATDYSRLALNSQTGGPFQLEVETAPSTVVRELDIRANGGLGLFNNVGIGHAPNLTFTTLIQGATSDNSQFALVVRNFAGTNILTARNDGPSNMGINNEFSVSIDPTTNQPANQINLNAPRIVVADGVMFHWSGMTAGPYVGGSLAANTLYLYASQVNGDTGIVQVSGHLQILSTFTLTATAGAATALPATPALYLTVMDSGGNLRKVPAYNP